MSQLTHAERMRLALAEAADRAIHGDHDLWPAISRQARAVEHWSAGKQSLLMRPIVYRALPATAVLLAVVLAAVLGLPAVYRALNSVPPALLTLAWGQSLARSSGGYTLTIRPMRADANEVVISYTLAWPAGEARNLDSSAFTDEQGTSRPPLLTAGNGTDLPFVPETGLALPASSNSNRPAIFDASPLPALPGAVALHLKMSLRPGLSASPTTQSRAARPWPPPQMPTPANRDEIVGPFDFDFQVPVDPVRRAAKPNVVTGFNGITMTLESVVVTAGETRIVIGAEGGAVTEIKEWQPTVILNAGNAADDRTGTEGLLRPRDQSTQRPEGGWIYSHYGSFLDRGTDWALALRDLRSPDGKSTLPGLWVFHFTVPPAEH